VSATGSGARAATTGSRRRRGRRRTRGTANAPPSSSTPRAAPSETGSTTSTAWSTAASTTTASNPRHRSRWSSTPTWQCSGTGPKIEISIGGGPPGHLDLLAPRRLPARRPVLAMPVVPGHGHHRQLSQPRHAPRATVTWGGSSSAAARSTVQQRKCPTNTSLMPPLSGLDPSPEPARGRSAGTPPQGRRRRRPRPAGVPLEVPRTRHGSRVAR